MQKIQNAADKKGKLIFLNVHCLEHKIETDLVNEVRVEMLICVAQKLKWLSETWFGAQGQGNEIGLEI